MRAIITAATVAVLLVFGALATNAVIGGQATAQESDDAPAEDQSRFRPGGLIAQTLEELVADGTITQDQADAITDALEAKVEEHRNEMEQRRDRFRDGRRRGFFFGRYLDDDLIDAAELEEIMGQLPDDHWLKDPEGPAAPYLEDDQLTVDELRQLHEDLHELRKSNAEESNGEGTST